MGTLLFCKKKPNSWGPGKVICTSIKFILKHYSTFCWSFWVYKCLRYYCLLGYPRNKFSIFFGICIPILWKWQCDFAYFIGILWFSSCNRATLALISSLFLSFLFVLTTITTISWLLLNVECRYIAQEKKGAYVVSDVKNVFDKICFQFFWRQLHAGCFFPKLVNYLNEKMNKNWVHTEANYNSLLLQE